MPVNEHKVPKDTWLFDHISTNSARLSIVLGKMNNVKNANYASNARSLLSVARKPRHVDDPDVASSVYINQDPGSYSRK